MRLWRSRLKSRARPDADPVKQGLAALISLRLCASAPLRENHFFLVLCVFASSRENPESYPSPKATAVQ
jgi:hypothetical protein